MKKIFIASGIAMLAFASLASAQGYTFSTNLTVGSTGPDVVALQTWLINSGYSIPAITAGTAKGMFGSQTRSAVQKYQAAHSIPSTGFVGPLTRTSLNGAATIAQAPAPSCPAGFVCTANTPNSPAAVSPSMITTPGVAGTLAFSLQSTPSNGTSVDKGQTASIARYKAQAGASDMAVSSLAIDFNTRFWLYASAITITDDSGAVIASKTNLYQSDFTEITVGSTYRLYIPISYIVPKAATKYFVVKASMLPITDRSAGSIAITQAQIRSIDGTGVVDTQTEAADRSFSFTGSVNGMVVITADENSPPNMLVPISTSGITQNVIMGIADFKSQGRDGVLRSLDMYVSISSSTAISTVFRDVKIKAGDLVYSADSVGDTVHFGNMKIPLPKDTIVPIIVLVDVNQDTNNVLDGISASTTVVASGTAGGTSNNPVVEDESFNTIDINDAPLATSDITFSANNSNIDYEHPPTATLGAPVISNNTVTGYAVNFTYTLVGGDSTLYVSKTPSVALSTTSTGFATNQAARLTDVTVTPGDIAGDTSTYYVVPAGSSRKFSYNGAVTNTGGTSGLKTFKITGINYGTNSSSLGQYTVVYYNYDALKVAPVFP